jgi:hypothetical protein
MAMLLSLSVRAMIRMSLRAVGAGGVSAISLAVAVVPRMVTPEIDADTIDAVPDALASEGIAVDISASESAAPRPRNVRLMVVAPYVRGECPTNGK